MGRFDPKDANFEVRVRTSFARQTAMATLGIEITGLNARRGRIEDALRRRVFATAWFYPRGYHHDCARYRLRICGFLPDARRCGGSRPSSSRPTSSPRLEAIIFYFGRAVLKPGRTITVCEAQAFAAEAGKEKLVATMTGTLMALFGREGIAH